MKKALVTGGLGFLGSSIVRVLLDRGVEVRVLALPNEPMTNVEGLDIEVMRGNVLDPDVCKEAVKGMDTVFHVAAVYKDYMPDPTPMYVVNQTGTYNMLEAARREGVEKTIYTASIVSLGRPPMGVLGDENTKYDAWDIDFAYGRSKFYSRLLAESFAEWGMDVRVVCPGIIFGPGDLGPTPSGKLIIETVKGENPPVYVDGGASYVDVRDCAEVHVLAAEKGKAGERYIASKHNLNNLQLIESVNSVAGVTRRYFRVPVPIARAAVSLKEAQDIRAGKEPSLTRTFFEYSLKPSFFNTEKSVRELGATYRPIEETIRDAIEWFRANGYV
ncbi:MAG: NAD-dependent epimerase/dehydratase family protein [Sandaracinaceae bacterium]|nr:NAD-dependent epimerase/dehydratase family protein [Sandaracinaceae bacterium]